MTPKKDIENILGSQWNALTPGEGVKMLLLKTPNALTKTKETEVIDTVGVLKILKEEAETVNTETAESAEVIMTKITTRVDTKSEDDHQYIAK